MFFKENQGIYIIYKEFLIYIIYILYTRVYTLIFPKKHTFLPKKEINFKCTSVDQILTNFYETWCKMIA